MFGLLLLMSASDAKAAPSSDLRASNTASEQTTLSWNWQPDDEIRYSLNGLDWLPVAPATAAIGVRVASGDAVDGNTRIIGLQDYVNYYFRVKNAGYSNVVVAYPPNEHAHRYFADDTNQCASCHSTHLSQSKMLLRESTLNAICRTCHAGTGSKYQVDAGTVTSATGTLQSQGGPFGTKLNPSYSGPLLTSSHQLGATISIAPGGDPTNTNGRWGQKLTCGSCHSAHSDGSYQYRLLLKVMPNMQLSGGPMVTSIDVEAYAVTGTAAEDAVYVSGLNTFCGGCHADYNTALVENSGSVPSGIFRNSFYRHAVDRDIAQYETGPLTTNLPLEAGATAFVSDGSLQGSGTVFCMTCHRAHGVTTPAPSRVSTYLLRMPNRGVCQNCHQK